MRISRLRLQNFKSFREADVTLRPFNVVIGPNASGKSNFIQAFRFLKDITTIGLENAVSMQGGSEFLPNVSAGPNPIVSILVEWEYGENEFLSTFLLSPERHISRPTHAKYELSLQFNTSESVYENVREELHQTFDIYDFSDEPSNEDEKELEWEPVGHGYVSIALKEGHANITREDFDIQGASRPVHIPPTLSSILASSPPLPPSKSLLEGSQFRVLGNFESILDGMSLYDLDPRLPKRGSLITGRADLESDGSNLAIVLNDITRQPERNRKFHNLINELLPFVEQMSVDRFADNSLLVNLRESYDPNRDLPASLLSDGTIGLTAIVIALAFEGNQVTILEEPDRNVHPHLISRLTSLMNDLQRNSQIIITTHNPEFVRNADIEDLILVHRDDQGSSKISRPAESLTVRAFLDAEMGVQDLYVDDLLTIGA